MKPRDRQAEILALVTREGEADVDELATAFDVSLETIRRDLQELASTGALHKVRGGARRIRLATEGSHRERMTKNAAEKQAIGRKVADLVEAGDTLFMDTGTTTLACAEALAPVEDLTVITNSLRIAQTMATQPPRRRIFLLGGAYQADNSETLGPMVIEQLERFQADHAVLSIAAMDAGAGAMDADHDEAQVARAMIDRARNTVVLAHAAKFGRRAAFRICRLDEIGVLVCDAAPGGELGAALTRAGVAVH